MSITKNVYFVAPIVMPPPTIQPIPSECNVCAGIPILNPNTCMCEGSSWWDGISCVTKTMCPCVVDNSK